MRFIDEAPCISFQLNCYHYSMIVVEGKGIMSNFLKIALRLRSLHSDKDYRASNLLTRRYHKVQTAVINSVIP